MDEKLKEKMLKIIAKGEKYSRMIQRFNKLANGEIIIVDNYSTVMVNKGIEKIAELLETEVELNDATLSDTITVGNTYIFQMIGGFNDFSSMDKGLEVVRCKDCKYYEEYKNGKYCCWEMILDPAEPTDFCSFGERREDAKIN